MKLSTALLMLACSAGIFTACNSATTVKVQPTAEPTTLPSISITQEAKPVKGNLALTLQEIAKHSIPDDCWFAVEGKVYDVTPYIAAGKHPGEEAILAGCGTDATTLFNTRPMGSGTPHSEKARLGLSQFYLGELVEVASPSATNTPESKG